MTRYRRKPVEVEAEPFGDDEYHVVGPHYQDYMSAQEFERDYEPVPIENPPGDRLLALADAIVVAVRDPRNSYERACAWAEILDAVAAYDMARAGVKND